STENRVRGVVVTFVDITDRKHAEALRARTEEYIAERLEQLEFQMDRIGVGVIVTDDSGRCSLFNTTAATILGHGRTDRPPREWPEQYGFYRPDGETLYAWEDLPVACALR